MDVSIPPYRHPYKLAPLTYIYRCIHIYLRSNLSKSTGHGTDVKWSIYRGGWFKELKYRYSGIVLDPNKAIGIGQWSVCGGGWLERFYCTCTQHIYIFT